MDKKKIKLDDDTEEFNLECSDLLNQAESDLLSLEKSTTFYKTYSAIFRVFHSLKGGAGMFGMQELNQHMHQLENDFTLCGARKVITSDEVSYFLKGVDAAKKILKGESVSFNFDNFTQKKVEAKIIPVLKSKQDGQVMIIDDEPEILEILVDILSKSNLEIITFTSPELAMKDFKKINPDVVLTDMKMPQVTGYDILQFIKKNNPDIPVIYISAHLEKNNLLKSISLGLFGAIEKPFKENEVLSITLSALKISKMLKLLGRSINLMLYQFADLEDFMKQNGRLHQAKLIKNELETLINYRNDIRTFKKAS